MDRWALKGTVDVKMEEEPASVKREQPPVQVRRNVATPPPNLRRSSRLAQDVICLTPDSCIFTKFKKTSIPKRGKKLKKPKTSKTPKSAKPTNTRPMRNIKLSRGCYKDVTSSDSDDVDMVTPPESDNSQTATTPNIYKDQVTTTPSIDNNNAGVVPEIVRTISSSPDNLILRFALKKNDQSTPPPLNSNIKVAAKHQAYAGGDIGGKAPKSKLPRFSFHKEPDEGGEDIFFGDNYSSSDTTDSDCGSFNEPQKREDREVSRKENRANEDERIEDQGKEDGGKDGEGIEDRGKDDKGMEVKGKEDHENRSITASSNRKASPSIPRFTKLSQLGSGLEPGPFPPARRGHLDPKWLTILRPVERIINVKPGQNGITVTLFFENSRFPSKVEHYHVWKFPKAATHLYTYFAELQLNNNDPFMQAGLAPFVQAVFDQVEINNKS